MTTGNLANLKANSTMNLTKGKSLGEQASQDNSHSLQPYTETEPDDPEFNNVMEYDSLHKNTKHMYGSGHKRYWNEQEVSIIRGFIYVRFAYKPSFDIEPNLCLV